MEGAHDVADEPTAVEPVFGGRAAVDVALAELGADEGDDRVPEIEGGGAEDGERFRLGRGGVEDRAEAGAGAGEDRGDPRFVGSSCHRLRPNGGCDEHWQSHDRDHANQPTHDKERSHPGYMTIVDQGDRLAHS
jgi:hypothetical protein